MVLSTVRCFCVVQKQKGVAGAMIEAVLCPDFSVVLLRSDFVLVSEKNHVKMHKNQWLLTPLSPLDIPCRAKTQAYPMGSEV